MKINWRYILAFVITIGFIGWFCNTVEKNGQEITTSANQLDSSFDELVDEDSYINKDEEPSYEQQLKDNCYKHAKFRLEAGFTEKDLMNYLNDNFTQDQIIYAMNKLK